MSAVDDPRVTFAELARWPDDGRQYELYDGEVIVVPSPFPRHQLVALHVQHLLDDYAEARGDLVLGSPIDIVLSRHNVVQPDVVYIKHERRHLINMWKVIRIPPDLVVEVLSRKTEMRDRNRKAELFARFGIPEYWILDPAKNTIEIYRNTRKAFRLEGSYAKGTVTSPTLSGLTFSVPRLFRK